MSREGKPPPRAGRSSRLSGFYRLPLAERQRALSAEGWLTPEGAQALARAGGFDVSAAENLSENVVGVHGLPLGLGLHFRVNGVDRIAPMAVEEPSVVAAASNAARLTLAGEGFVAEADPPLMVAQVELRAIADPERARKDLHERRNALISQANSVIPEMVRRGGGVVGIELRELERTPAGAHLVVELVTDVRDAMGANVLNTLAEAMAAPIQAVTGGRIGLRILTNLADRRKVRVRVKVPRDVLGVDHLTGAQVCDGIEEASRFAELDPYRAATHNKGIMNGVDAVVLATGNDWRAVEAGAHAYAAMGGRYRPLATWRHGKDGLEGALEMPLALGIVGGASRAHPGVRLALELASATSAADLAMLAGAVGLASNLAALKALATVGIQRGHMALHARTVAVEAGALAHEIEAVALELSRIGDFRPDAARAALERLRA